MIAAEIAILAAGAGRRFGGCKPLAELAGKPLLQHAIDHCRALDGIVGISVILGSDAAAITAGVACNGIAVRINADWREGMASSIRTAVSGVAESCTHLLLLAADQPRVTPRDLRALLDAAAAAPDAAIAAAYADTLGIPAVFPRQWFARLDALRGDRGAGSLLRAPGAGVVTVALPGAAFDIDTPAALRALQGS